MRRICHRIRAREPAGGSESGLTLAEMLLVLAILALVAGLVVGRGLPGRGAVRSATLEAFLRDARAHAMLAGRPVHLSGTPHGISGDGAGLELGRGFLVELRANDGSADGHIAFAADGSTNGGTVMVLAPDGSSYGVVVAPLTGTVTPLRP